MGLMSKEEYENKISNLKYKGKTPPPTYDDYIKRYKKGEEIAKKDYPNYHKSIINKKDNESTK